MIFRPSGGLRYHWRAWRERARWQNFTNDVADWLSNWRPPCRQLILLGPSGGYTLPTAWLKSFDCIDAYDLDPLAPLFFKWRHSGVRIHFHRQDLFWVDGRLSAAPIKALITQSPQSAFLFSNILGQVLLEGHATEAQWQEYLSQLRNNLTHHHWASYHDLFTREGHEVTDHLMRGPWSAGLPSRQWKWPLTAKSEHTIEGLIHSPRPWV